MFQPSGSFMIRGRKYIARKFNCERTFEIYWIFWRNAGYSLAYAGKKLGADIKVVIPESTSSYMINKI